MSSSKPESSGDGDQASSFSRSTPVGAGVATSEDLSARVSKILKNNAPANRFSPTEEAAMRKKVYAFFGATSEASKDEVRDVLVVYFSLNIPSGRTDWSKANPVVVSGKSYPINRLVGPIIPNGDAGVIKFLRGWSAATMNLLNASPEFRLSLAARVAKAGLRPGEEAYVLPWVDEPGMNSATRVRARVHLTSTRADLGTEVEREARKAALGSSDDLWTN